MGHTDPPLSSSTCLTAIAVAVGDGLGLSTGEGEGDGDGDGEGDTDGEGDGERLASAAGGGAAASLAAIVTMASGPTMSGVGSHPPGLLRCTLNVSAGSLVGSSAIGTLNSFAVVWVLPSVKLTVCFGIPV